VRAISAKSHYQDKTANLRRRKIHTKGRGGEKRNSSSRKRVASYAAAAPAKKETSALIPRSNVQ